jgi:hypothetical protein
MLKFVSTGVDFSLMVMLMGLGTFVFDHVIISSLTCAAALCIASKYVHDSSMLLKINSETIEAYFTASWEHFFYMVLILELYFNVTQNHNIRALACFYVLMREICKWLERHTNVLPKTNEDVENSHTSKELERFKKNYATILESYNERLKDIKTLRKLLLKKAKTDNSESKV